MSRIPCLNGGYTDFNKQSNFSTFIQDLLLKGAIKTVQKPDSLGFYSRLFLFPKPGNRWRPVTDLSCFNKFLAIPKFKMETTETIWVISINLTDTYLHIPFHPQSQKYLMFCHKGVTYQFTSLPFGLSMTPLIFTALAKEVRLLALQQGLQIHQYLDNWLIHRTGVLQESLYK